MRFRRRQRGGTERGGAGGDAQGAADRAAPGPGERPGGLGPGDRSGLGPGAGGLGGFVGVATTFEGEACRIFNGRRSTTSGSSWQGSRASWAAWGRRERCCPAPCRGWRWVPAEGTTSSGTGRGESSPSSAPPGGSRSGSGASGLRRGARARPRPAAPGRRPARLRRRASAPRQRLRRRRLQLERVHEHAVLDHPVVEVGAGGEARCCPRRR